jgi:hypothetical protein
MSFFYFTHTNLFSFKKKERNVSRSFHDVLLFD